MKFIDFNNKAIGCLDPNELKRLIKLENTRFAHSEPTNTDAESEVTLVCMSYDKELISCHYAEILYDDMFGAWELKLNIEESVFPAGLAKFKTKEDAIKAARLCKNAKTVVEAGEIIAKEFPEFAAKILAHLDDIKNNADVNI